MVMSAELQAVSLEPVSTHMVHHIDDELCIVVDDNASTVSQWPNVANIVAHNLLGAAQAQGIEAIDLHFLQSKERLKGTQRSEAIKDIFSKVKPIGNAPIWPKLSQLLQACLSTFSVAPKWALSSMKTIKVMHYQILAENLLSDDRRKIEQTLAETSTWLSQNGLSSNQIVVSFVHFGWYSAFAREEFQVMSQNLPRLGILNTIISLAPDSFLEGPETDGEFISRAVLNLLDLLSDTFYAEKSVDNVSNLLVEARQSAISQPSSPAPKARPVALLDTRHEEMSDALDSTLPTEVTSDQAFEWTKILRPIVTGKRALTDEDFALAITALDDVDRLKSIISKSVLQDTQLCNAISQLIQNETLPEADVSSSRLWLARKAASLAAFFQAKFGP